jgi:lipid-binding SYLF domain-containing protein
MKNKFRFLFPVIFMAFLGGTGLAGNASAASPTEIDIAVDGGLAKFKKEVAGGAEFLDKAKGYLVFPKVTKAGLVVGGEYGEGALRIDGKTEDYYNIASASFGLQIGAQQYAIVMVFLQDDAMKKFRESKGWEAGVDGSVAIAKWGAGEDINTQNFKDPIVGFVFGNKGLMAGVSIEGSKITKLDK